MSCGTNVPRPKRVTKRDRAAADPATTILTAAGVTTLRGERGNSSKLRFGQRIVSETPGRLTRRQWKLSQTRWVKQ